MRSIDVVCELLRGCSPKPYPPPAPACQHHINTHDKLWPRTIIDLSADGAAIFEYILFDNDTEKDTRDSDDNSGTV